MNLLIVEDELRLRSGLANTIGWEQYDIEIIGLAADGLEAIKLIELKKPDIILLDIQIPGIDGIELARRVKQEHAEIQIIVLSGHDNFYYAQTALELGVFRYLLKPAGEEEIISAVVEASALIKQRFEEKIKTITLNNNWEEYLPRLQESYLLYLINGKAQPDTILKKLEQLQLNMSVEQGYIIAVVDVDPFSEDNTQSIEKDFSSMQFMLFNIAKEILKNDGMTHWLLQDTNGSTIIIFESTIENKQQSMIIVHQLVNKILSSMKTHFFRTASAGICSHAGYIDELNKLYIQSISALKERLLLGHNIVIPYTEPMQQEEYRNIEPYMEKELEIALETGDLLKTLTILNEWWEVTVVSSKCPGKIEELVLYLSSFYIRLIHKQGWVVRDVMGQDYVYFQNLLTLTTKQQIHEWITRISKNFIEFKLNEKKNVSHSAIKAIFDLIEKEMSEELTLQMVADKLYINSSYLSRLFKKETGKSFSTYVMERKMETAKQLLLKGSKVYDAANITGFKDPSYFTKVFRKYWGKTPGEILK